ncbi:MAG: 4Fe-4S binding protein [Candidatus Aegiribacteria sp.]|nr:4Fe-4S binding protein [Candidatus Aegiribacteria sp.]
MRISALVLIIFTAVLFAFCPLGLPPEEACSADNPSCALFVDENADGLCDNPDPEPGGSSDQDTVETEEVPEIINTEDPAEEQQEPPPDSVQQTDIPEVIAEEDDSAVTVEISEEVTESAVIIEETEIDVLEDSVIVDTVTVEETEVSLIHCPLNLTPGEACSEDSQRCTFYRDFNENLLCDNPGEQTDSTALIDVNISETTSSLQIESSGCPLNLPPEAACPAPEDRLCPHYRGSNGCINPSGGGVRRTQLIIIATAILLPAATFLKKRYRGRRKTDRHRRKIAHMTVQAISILILGFFVQGSYCPLGVFQYIFLPGGVIFLGGVGVAVLLLPMIWSLFIGRIYCGWVCPFGALQDLLGKMNVPRPPAFPKKVHRFLINFKYVLTVVFIGALILTGKGFFGKIIPASLFCQIDPFHTIYSYFIVGSFTGAIASICFMIFFPRFFCKYLCFYGAVLSILGRVRLWARIRRKHGR